MLRPKTPVDSFRYALNGVLLSFKTQKHLRIHFALAFMALLAAFIWQVSRAELLVLMGAISLVILAELFNTALETVVDLVTPDYHPLAKVAKDVAAGAVMVAAINAAVVGLILFVDLDGLRKHIPVPEDRGDALRTAVMGMVMLLLLLVIWKVKGGKGRFLQGGVVSGHSAIAFFLCTLILLLSQHPFVAFLAIVIASLVAQSRVEAGIHTLREVLFGAILGILLPVILYRLIPVLLRHVVLPSLGSAH